MILPTSVVLRGLPCPLPVVAATHDEIMVEVPAALLEDAVAALAAELTIPGTPYSSALPIRFTLAAKTGRMWPKYP